MTTLELEPVAEAQTQHAPNLPTREFLGGPLDGAIYVVHKAIEYYPICETVERLHFGMHRYDAYANNFMVYRGVSQ